MIQLNKIFIVALFGLKSKYTRLLVKVLMLCSSCAVAYSSYEK